MRVAGAARLRGAQIYCMSLFSPREPHQCAVLGLPEGGAIDSIGHLRASLKLGAREPGIGGGQEWRLLALMSN